MRRVWRAGLGGLLLLPAAAWLALRIGLLTPFVNLALRHQLKGRSPVEIRVGALRSDVTSFIELDDIVAVAPAGKVKLPLVTVANLRLEYAGWSALRGRLDWSEALRLARVRGLSVFLLRESGGRWNVEALAPSHGGAAGTSKGEEAGSPELPLLPAGRVELEDSQVVVNDEERGFHASIERLQGSLDTRALPLLAFSLNGRTEGKSREDLSLAGELDRRDGSLFGRLDLASVPLARYLNYFLPAKGLAFEAGTASLSVRLRRRRGDDDFEASGRAEIHAGSLRIPGISEPLTGLEGAASFDPSALRFRSMRAHFLGSDWNAAGSIDELRHPSFNVSLSNTAFPLQALSEQVKGMGVLAMTGTAEVVAQLSGPAAHPVVEAGIQAPWMGLFGAELENVSASARLAGTALTVERLSGGLWGGHIDGRADMGLARGGKLDAQVDIRGAELRRARIHGVLALPLTGTANVSVLAKGQLLRPAVSLDLSVSGTSLGVLPLGDFNAKADWGPGGLASQFATADRRLEGSINFKRNGGAAFYDSRISLKFMDMAALAHGLAGAGESIVLPQAGVRAGAWLDVRLAGSLSADLSFDGPVASPTTWIRMRLREGRFFTRPGPWALRQPKDGMPIALWGDLGFQKGLVLCGRDGQPLHVTVARRGRNLQAQFLGRYPLVNSAGRGKLEMALDGDLRVLDSFEAFDKSKGRLTADVVLGGTPDSPQAQGSLRVEDFSTKPSHYLAPVEAGQLVLSFRGQQFDLESLSFKSGGVLDAHGSLDLSGGLKGMQGRVELNTDDTGLRLQNWDEMGSGNLELHPLVVVVSADRPLRLEGKIRLGNALVTYAGPQKKSGPQAEAGPPSRGLDLALRVALGANVWYEKRQAGGVDVFDPKKWISGLTDSVQETFLRPDVFFRLRPTDEDISIQGQTPDVRLSGELAIDRGRLTFMENDFEIRPDLGVTAIRFDGRRAEVRATAVGRLRYTRDDPLTGRPRQKAVNVIIPIVPLDPYELERSSLANAFLNYSLRSKDIRAEPDLENVPASQQNEAAINLIVFGDPLVDLQQTQVSGGGSKVLEAQINRILSGELKRQLAKLSKKGFKFLGGQFIDVLRVVPRFKYQAAPTGGNTTLGQANQQAQDSGLVFSDLTVEIGKSLGERLYASMQWVRFGENGSGTSNAGVAAGTQIVRDNGLRAGLEYQISPNRTAELYYNYSVDDNLEPVPFDPRELWQAHSAVFRIRNTLPTDNYSPELARERRFDKELIP